MEDKKTWYDKLIRAGARDSSAITTHEKLKEVEMISVYWMNKNEYDSIDYIPIRNKLSREMRKDNWQVKCSSPSVMGRNVIKLEAERKK